MASCTTDRPSTQTEVTMATSPDMTTVDVSPDTRISGPAERARPGKTPQAARNPSVAHPVDKGWAWAVMIGAFGVHFMSFGFIRSFGILFLEFQDRFEASSAMTAVIVGVQFCAHSLSTFLAVNLALKRFSVRQSCLVGCCLQSLGILLNGVVPGIAYLLFTQGILFGTGLALVYCPALIILSQYFNSKRAVATAIAASGVAAGGMTLPPLIRYFLDNYDLRGTLLLLAAVMFNQAVFVSLFTPPGKYTFVKSDNVGLTAGEVGKVDNKTTENDAEEKETSNNLGKRAGLNENTRFHNGISYQDGENTLLDGQYSQQEESRRLLENSQDGSQRLNRPENHGEIVVPTGRSTRELVNEEGTDCEGKGVLSNYTTRMSNDSSVLSNQLAALANRSHSLSQSKTELSHQHQSVQINETNSSPKDVALFHGQSLKECVFQALSTSSLDVYGSLHDVSSRVSPPFVDASRQISEQSYTAVKEDRETSGKRKRFCRLPQVTKTIPFWLLLVFYACGGAGSGLPPIFVPPLAKEKGMHEKASLLLMVSAVTELIGRLLPGVILHFGFMSPSTLLIAPLAVCATLYQFTAFYNDFNSLLAMVLLSGLFTGTFWTTQSLVVIEVYGLGRLGPMLGFFVLVVGVSVGSCNPLSGFLRDVSGSYSLTFHFFGVIYYIASLMLVFVQLHKKCTNQTSYSVANH